ncbi:MAG TPA: hypothetical protein VMZ71_02615 [Gemmataceae bacterium]|nr:hypothetical protein [Gemmataceae bacterium]
MTEDKWLQSTDGDAMLDVVAARLTPRHWVLLSAAYVRRLWELLPAGVLRDAIEAAERAEKPLTEAARKEWLRKIDAGIPEAVSAAEFAQREIVKSADPDSADQTDPILARPTQIAPAFPLFRAASNHARNAIHGIADALTQSAEAVRVLFGEPTEDMLEQARSRVEQAAETRTTANRSANNALRLKQEGDELADRAATAKNKRLEESKALEIVRKLEEGPSRSDGDQFEAEMKREKAAKKHLARLLREVVGNPFTPPRFEKAWRTSTVKSLAKGIFEERAFDRMPILADALLDADCDEEAVLRHCRGTEIGPKEPPLHVRGCWVIELALNRWKPLPPPPKNPPPRPRRDFDDLDIGLPPDDDTAFA